MRSGSYGWAPLLALTTGLYQQDMLCALIDLDAEYGLVLRPRHDHSTKSSMTVRVAIAAAAAAAAATVN